MNIGTGVGAIVTEDGTNDNIWIDSANTVTVNGGWRQRSGPYRRHQHSDHK